MDRWKQTQQKKYKKILANIEKLIYTRTCRQNSTKTKTKIKKIKANSEAVLQTPFTTGSKDSNSL